MKIGEKIYNNLKEKYEIKSILFCPYKEEMFDSMQTVYEAAMKDDTVEVGIMSIPYYTLWNLIPVGMYHEFNGIGFPEALNRKWDVILFHYPYDHVNTITRPLIPSNVLKCFCSKLVYLPYFLTERVDYPNRESILPGYKNSDLIIVDNEKQKEYMLNLFKGHNIGAEVEAWGSPKYDKRKTDIPAFWEYKVKGRKVVLLQTSLIPYMQNPEKLKEIEEFVDNSKDCILWRPHPLYFDTIKAMRPYELPRFMRIKDKVDIYDDTPDYQNAFEFCDEMISDGSSLDLLFKATGKPFKELKKPS